MVPSAFISTPLIRGSKVQFEGRNALLYPSLAHLCEEHGYLVFETFHPGAETSSSAYLLVPADFSSLEDDAISPCFPCLSYLDAYADEQMIDILHGQRFSSEKKLHTLHA